jgi:hypothetical protein
MVQILLLLHQSLPDQLLTHGCLSAGVRDRCPNQDKKKEKTNVKRMVDEDRQQTQRLLSSLSDTCIYTDVSTKTKHHIGGQTMQSKPRTKYGKTLHIGFWI